MTADHADGRNDDTLAAVASLRNYDVSPRRSRQLRRRCHTMLQTQPPRTSAATAIDTTFRWIIGPALGGAWCLAYLVEIFRRAAAVYLGTP
jgi:hypothetical protein